MMLVGNVWSFISLLFFRDVHQNFFNFGPPCTVDIHLNDVENRRTVEVAQDKGKVEKLYLFLGNEGVSGKVTVTMKEKTKKIEHQGIKVEFIGQIGMMFFFILLGVGWLLSSSSLNISFHLGT